MSTSGAINRKWKEYFPKPSQIYDKGVKNVIRRVVQEPRTTYKVLQKDLELAGAMIPNTKPGELSIGFK